MVVMRYIMGHLGLTGSLAGGFGGIDYELVSCVKWPANEIMY